VSKGDVIHGVKEGCIALADLKTKTKAGTGCGGCMPLVTLNFRESKGCCLTDVHKVTKIFNSELKKAGHLLSNNLCPHFAMSRTDLFSIIKVKKLKDFFEVMSTCGVKKDALGCEICKPAIGSILSSL
jgi:nitrite reductase (NAD(P)H)